MIKAPGQSLAEYGLVMALVLIVSIAGLQLFGKNISQAFEAMLPAPGATSTVTASVSSPSDTIVSDPLAALSADVDGSGSLASTTAVKKKQKEKPKLSMSDKLLKQYRGITQTAGSLGNSQQLFASSNELVKQAMKYKKSDPVLFNQIVKMGINGKQLAKKINAYETNRTEANHNAVVQSGGRFAGWAWAADHSKAMKNLKADDQALVRDLGDSNYHTAFNVWRQPSNGVVDHSASKSVNKNSKQIITCGKKHKCGKK